jgi:hypothetical protein
VPLERSVPEPEGSGATGPGAGQLPATALESLDVEVSIGAPREASPSGEAGQVTHD